jgi:hypothetical protein
VQEVDGRAGMGEELEDCFLLSILEHCPESCHFIAGFMYDNLQVVYNLVCEPAARFPLQRSPGASTHGRDTKGTVCRKHALVRGNESVFAWAFSSEMDGVP